MNLPNVAAPDEWLAARQELLAREKEFTRQRDALSTARRALPMVAIEKEYAFEGPNGPAGLRDLFDGRRRLVVYHFMFDPNWSAGCKGCSFVMDNVAGAVVHLAARDTSFAAVSRAPFAKIEPFRRRMGWPGPWFSSSGTEFNDDFHVTLDPDHDESVYNYVSVAVLVEGGKLSSAAGEIPGLSVFLRTGDRIFHTYSTYGRGLDHFLNTYNLPDLTPLGRQEERGQTMSWLRHHDAYAPQVLAGQCHCPEATS
jgi:predicted dithiol-disulfide oxidoreductase (DUF899 family)